MTFDPYGHVPHRMETLLIVDDEKDILDATRDILAKELDGVRVLTARDAHEALRVLQSTRVDLIVADYKMPQKDGIELLREARLIQPEAESILLTAYLDKDLAQRALHEAGVREMFRKPFTVDQLRFAVLSRLYNHDQAPVDAAHDPDSVLA